jgi:hypothetical protein
MSVSFFSSQLIVTGPAGCGKSHFIKQQAAKEGKILLHCACRKDRTLREGRQILHTWAKRSENSVIWLEGADDLTPESQAFLRRISETHSPFVSFILECRDGSKLQEPIRSRYSIWNIARPSWQDLHREYPDIEKFPEIKTYLEPKEYSFRKIQHCLDLARNHPEDWQRWLEVRRQELTTDEKYILNTRIKKLQESALNPSKLIEKFLLKNPNMLLDYGGHIFNNGNPWAFMKYLTVCVN